MPWTFYTATGVAKTGEYLGSEFPVGTIVQTAASSAGTGWLMCDGSSLVRATYPELFSAIGTTYGSASGTTFNLPDMRGRVPLAAGTGTGLTARTLAATGGAESVTLAATQIPGHTHSGTTGNDSPDHSHSGTTGYMNQNWNHSHSLPNVVAAGGGGSNFTSGPNWTLVTGTGGTDTNHTHNFGTGGASARHQHSFTTDNGTGGGLSHENMSPFIVVNFMIYAVTYARRAA